MGRVVLVIDDFPTWEAYCRKHSVTDIQDIFTDNPYLFEYLSARNYSLVAFNDIYDEGKILTFSNIASYLSWSWVSLLNTEFKCNDNGYHLGNGLKRHLPNMLNSVLYKALLLERLSTKYDTIRIPLLLPKNKENLNRVVLSPFICNYFYYIAERSDHERYQLVKLEGFDSGSGSESSIGIGEKIRYQCLRFSSYRKSFFKAILYRIIKKFGSFNPFGRSIAYYINDNDVLRDSLLRLIIKFKRVYCFTLSPLTVTKATCSDNAENEELFYKQLDYLNIKFTRTSELESAVQVAIQRLVLFIGEVKANLGSYLNYLDNIFEASKNKDSIVFSNGVFGMEAEILFQYLINHGKELCVFEHGSVGLCAFDYEMQLYSDKSSCSYYVQHNQYEARFSKKLMDMRRIFFIAQNIRKLFEPRIRWCSRFLARWLLKIKSDQFLVLFAPTRFKESNNWLFNEFKDMQYWQHIKETVLHFNSKNIRLHVKFHQKGLYKTEKEIYKLRKIPVNFINSTKNITTSFLPQFIYLRCAADLTIIDRATSTLQWAVTSGRPVLYLDSGFAPLVEEVKASMQKAIFYISKSEDSWQSSLDALLSLGKNGIRREWERKQTEREEFINEYLIDSTTRGSYLQKMAQ